MTMFKNFIEEWIWVPIKYDLSYNPVDTLVYSIIFVAAIYLLYEYYFKKCKIKIDRNFIIALSGWILFGSSLRVLEDVNVYQTFLLRTPFIFILVFALAFSLFVISRHFDKKIPYYKTWGSVGYVLSIVNIMRLPLPNLYGLSLALLVSSLWLVLFIGLRKIIPKFMSWWNIAVIQAHMFDASCTFVAIQFFGFTEKHVLGGFLTTGYGAWTMFPMKLAVVPIVLYLIDKYLPKDQERKYFKMIILLLGLATGLRDLLQLVSLG